MKDPKDLLASHRVLSRAVDRIGAKRVAQELKISSALVYKWCEPVPSGKTGMEEGSGVANPLDRLQKLVELDDDDEMVAWLCRGADGFFSKNPPRKTVGRRDLFDNIQRLVKEFSDTLDAISSSYKEGNAINGEEARRIRREWDQLKGVGESLVNACECGNYHGKKKRSSGGK